MAVPDGRHDPARDRRACKLPTLWVDAGAWGDAIERTVASPLFSYAQDIQPTGRAMSGPVNPVGESLGWTPERVALLRRHFAVGLSAAESAMLLGGVSKNAVIAKRLRLGLAGAARFKTDSGPRGRRLCAPVIRIAREPKFRRSALPSMDEPPPPDAQPKRLVQHQRRECVWPLGGAGEAGDWRTLFCCAPIVMGGRYCATHAARARR